MKHPVADAARVAAFRWEEADLEEGSVEVALVDTEEGVSLHVGAAEWRFDRIVLLRLLTGLAADLAIQTKGEDE